MPACTRSSSCTLEGRRARSCSASLRTSGAYWTRLSSGLGIQVLSADVSREQSCERVGCCWAATVAWRSGRWARTGSTLSFQGEIVGK
ncbi:Uncharacterised protein [Bordetella pertussis]|nr:Uncharacterised protein [Bordetella pertussis]CFW43033.1 Uncharacterised protein [Bordetella pertussis]